MYKIWGYKGLQIADGTENVIGKRIGGGEQGFSEVEHHKSIFRYFFILN